jgi:1-acyl-sn-glycerol-3-phosphate acyltransferase
MIEYRHERKRVTKRCDAAEKHMRRLGYALIRALGWIVALAQMRLRVVGVERVPAKGGVILVCNHLGVIDPLPIGLRLPREMRMLAKIEIFHRFVLGGLARMAGAVSIRRGESDREALQTTLDLLKAGECLLVFPEGTYAHAPKPVGMLPLKTGAAWLALRSGCLVVPVGICGTERVWHWSRGWRPWRRPLVHVVFGAPYVPQAPAGVSLKVALQAVTDEMGHRIAALLPGEYRGVQADAWGSAIEKTAPPAPRLRG